MESRKIIEKCIRNDEVWNSILFLMLFVVTSSSYATPNIMTFQSRIVKPNGQPMEEAAVHFRFSITDALGTCIIYQEDFTNRNMSGSKGLINLNLGGGSKVFPVGAMALSEVFNNYNFPTFNCQAGGTINAGATDRRRLVMQFNDGNGWQTTPAMDINSNPFAMQATTAHNLGSYPAADYLRTASMPTCGLAQALHFNGTTITCVAAGGAGAGTVTQVTSANTDIGVTNTSTIPELTLNVGAGANQIVKLNGSSELPAVSGVNLTALNAANIASGTIAAGRMPALTGDITMGAGTTATTIAAGAILDADINAAAAIARNKIAASTVGERGDVLINDGSGVMSTLQCNDGEVIKFNGAGVAVCGTDNSGTGDILQNGNSFAGTMTIGTNSNHNLEFETNGTTKMTILAGGNVGIGTTVPTAKLQISGDLRFSNSAARTVDVEAETTVAGRNLTLMAGNTSAPERGGNLILKAGSTSSMVAFDSFGGSVLIDAGTGGDGRGNILLGSVSGNVGIGTTNPGTNILSVDGGSVGRKDITLKAGDDVFMGSNPGHVNITAGYGFNDGGDINLTTGFGDNFGGQIGTVNILSAGVVSAVRMDGGAGLYPGLDVYRDNSGPSANSGTGITFSTRDASNSKRTMANFYSILTDTSAANIKSDLSFESVHNGAMSEKMRISSAGNVGIGTNNPNRQLVLSKTDASPQMEIINTNSTSARNPSLSITNYRGAGATAGYTSLIFNNFRGASGAPVMTANNDQLGFIGYGGVIQDPIDGPGISSGSMAIELAADANWNNSQPTRLSFYSTQTHVPVERMRIDRNGIIGIGTTSPGARLDVADTGTTTSAIIVPRAGNFTGTAVNGMIRYNSTATLFEFYQNGSWVNYTTVSDGRLKTDVVPVTDGLAIVNQLNPVFYNWDRNNPKASSFEDKHQVGFIAQEVEKVLPEVVNKGADSYRSIEYGKIVSVVVSAIKELYNNALAKDIEIQKLKDENAEMKARLAQIEKILSSK